MAPELRRTRRIWAGLAGLVVLLVLANLALSARGPARLGFVPGCTGCHDGLLVPVR